MNTSFLRHIHIEQIHVEEEKKKREAMPATEPMQFVSLGTGVCVCVCEGDNLLLF